MVRLYDRSGRKKQVIQDQRNSFYSVQGDLCQPLLDLPPMFGGYKQAGVGDIVPQALICYYGRFGTIADKKFVVQKTG